MKTGTRYRGIRAEASFPTIKKKCSEQRPVLECSFAQEFTRNNAATNHKALDPAIGISVGSIVYRLVLSQPSCKRFFLLLFLFLFPSTSVFLLVYIAFKKSSNPIRKQKSEPPARTLSAVC
jgi:multisubunit Na+/H+ antiporter MnhG subunit